ncbi:MAG: MoxR family ATPase [SAR324 cluster bacterium]|nr:MoxR family ATPase [SAR324 cluster bacterium]
MTSVNPSPFDTQEIQELHQQLMEFPEKFKTELRQVIVGQEDILDLLVLALFCNGHVLLTGVPGLAKTLLIRAISSVFHLNFNRIQCTPDLMPSDVIGNEILEEHPGTGERFFRLVHGPVFTNLLLVDEINRTSPRTQSALLQAMQERQVSIAGKTYELAPPFMVFATQNPIDSEGTYPLPEAQLDRFLFNIEMTYPSLEDEILIAARPVSPKTVELSPIFDAETLLKFQEIIHQIPVPPYIVRWIVELVKATRPQESTDEIIQKYVAWGAGVRASQNIVMASKARALLDGQTVVNGTHVRGVLHAVLRHRIIPGFMGEAAQWTADRIVDHLLSKHPAPF